jgi:hypothetical protein
MNEEPDNLVLLLLQEIRTEVASLGDDVNVLTAIVQRLDNSHTRLLTEIRAIHSQVSRHGERLRRLESLAPTDSDKSAELSERGWRPKSRSSERAGISC